MTTNHAAKSAARRRAKETGEPYAQALRAVTRDTFVKELKSLEALKGHLLEAESHWTPPAIGYDWSAGASASGEPVVVQPLLHDGTSPPMRVVGAPGTGKTMTLHSMLEQQSRADRIPPETWLVSAYPDEFSQEFRERTGVARFVGRFNADSEDSFFKEAEILLIDALTHVAARAEARLAGASKSTFLQVVIDGLPPDSSAAALSARQKVFALARTCRASGVFLIVSDHGHGSEGFQRSLFRTISTMQGSEHQSHAAIGKPGMERAGRGIGVIDDRGVLIPFVLRGDSTFRQRKGLS